MRKLLLVLVLALLVGATLMWLMQNGTGYVLVGFANTSIEMSLWVAGLLFILFTFALLWLLLLTRWVISAGGFSRWWNSRRNAKQLGKTAQGLLLYADQDWSKASEMLASSAQLSSMPQVNLLFAAQAAANNQDTDRANALLERLKDSHPKAETAAIKAEVELLVRNQQLPQALRLMQALHRDRPTDTGVLRQLMDIYCLQRDWSSAQKLLRDFKHYGALPKQGAAAVEIEVYSGLFTDFVAGSDLNNTEQYNQLAELWELVPKGLRKTPELVAPFADALAQIKATDKLLPLLSKTLNNQWHPDLIERFGTLPIATPEKQLAMAEKWLVSHSEDADLLLALGRICRRLEFMGKARDYLSTAITIDPRPQTYLELAQVLDILGESDASADVYRQGLEARLTDSM